MDGENSEVRQVSDHRNEARELKNWLQRSNCQQHYSKFVEHGIKYDLLSELDTDSLKEIGITKLGDRLRLELAISSLKTEKLMNSVTVDELYRLMNIQLSSRSPQDATLPVNLLNRNLQEIIANNDSGTLVPTASGQYTINNSSVNASSSSLGTSKDSNKNITFILQDGSTKRVNVTGCFNAQSIKRKVLKRLGIKQQETAYDTYIHSPVQGEGSNPAPHEGVNLLFDVELVTICYSPERMEKHRIIFCAKNEYPTTAAIDSSMRIMQKYDKFMKNQAHEISQENLSQYHIPEKKKQINRPTLKNFFGQRPPSELISSNLAEYFPDTRQKDLEATVRNSVRYSVRLSRRFNLPSGPPSIHSSNLSVNNRHSSLSNATIITPVHSMSIASGDFQAQTPKRHIPGRSIGDVMVNNINAIDEAVGANDTQSLFGKPPSIISNTSLPTSTPGSDSRSISSTNSGRPANGLYNAPHHRISIAASFAESSKDNAGNNRYSRIELLSVDSDSDDADDFLAVYGEDDESNEHVLDSISEDGPKNWLKGARIGAGSFGTVYLGMNPLTGELMAVKQIPLPNKNSSGDAQKTMLEQQREMTLLKELNHENIVRYFGASTDDSHINIFLEYVPGGSVQSMLTSYGPFEEPLIRNFIRQVLIGLSYLHGEDIIHRDIKGANILIDIKGTVKIGDFGISKRVSNGEEAEEDEAQKKGSRRASLQGSVFWMAPEVVKQTTYTKKADIWSVGCLIVEMFTGKHPFPDFSQMQAIFKIGTHITPQIPEWCTLEAKDFLVKTFEIDYDKRPDAIELLSDSFLNPLILSKH